MEENCTIIDNEILLIWLTVSAILILAAIIHIFIRNMIIIRSIEEIALDLSLGNSIGMLVYIYYIYYKEKCRNCHPSPGCGPGASFILVRAPSFFGARMFGHHCSVPGVWDPLDSGMCPHRLGDKL